MEKYDVLLVAGQSNAAGFGHGPTKEPYIPDSRVLYLTHGRPAVEEYDPQGEMEIRIAEEEPNPAYSSDDKLGDFALSFAKAYVEAGLLAPDRKLLIVRSAVGGTGFLKGYWRVGDPLYNRMLRMTDYALSLNPENRLVAMLWHQGEHEAAHGNDPKVYHAQLQAVVQSVRNRYENPALPFICGGFCDEWVRENQPACGIIMDVIRAVAEEAGGIYVHTADLRSNNQKHGDGDIIHFCREDLAVLGRRYFDAYRKLI